LMVKFGQRVCMPRNPRCGICRVAKYCDYYENVYSKGAFGSPAKNL